VADFSVVFYIQPQKIILVRCHPLEGVTQRGKETTAKKVTTTSLSRGGRQKKEKKVVSFFGRQNRVTP